MEWIIILGVFGLLAIWFLLMLLVMGPKAMFGKSENYLWLRDVD